MNPHYLLDNKAPHNMLVTYNLLTLNMYNMSIFLLMLMLVNILLPSFLAHFVLFHLMFPTFHPHIYSDNVCLKVYTLFRNLNNYSYYNLILPLYHLCSNFYLLLLMNYYYTSSYMLHLTILLHYYIHYIPLN